MTDQELRTLPGGDLVARGLGDLAAGRESLESLLVEIAASRLRYAGLDVPEIGPRSEAAELRLYKRLEETHPAPYGAYNSLLRQLASCARALEVRPLA
ncbi:MAG: hypothetical protein ACRD2Z_15700 [Thermoanaerobaculia bacterium]